MDGCREMGVNRQMDARELLVPQCHLRTTASVYLEKTPPLIDYEADTEIQIWLLYSIIL